METVVKSRYRILYGDTDAMGIAYYANYLKWFEMGRNEWLRNMGVTYAQIESNERTFAPVTKAFCHYLKPARYDEVIVVETGVEYIRKASIKFIYRILREEDGEELVQGYTIHAFVDEEGRIVRTPPSIARLMDRMKDGGSLTKIKKFHNINSRDIGRGVEQFGSSSGS